MFIRSVPDASAAVMLSSSKRGEITQLSSCLALPILVKLVNVMGVLGDEIRRLRQERKLKLLELAERIDTTAGYVSRVETRDEVPSAEMICRLAGALRADPKKLLDLAKRDVLQQTAQELEAKHQHALTLFRRKK
jgi:ribosome-binding protein aMBF1 (putative translation factor)